MIQFKDKNGNEISIELDNNRVVYFRDSTGECNYDSNGNIVHWHDFGGLEEEEWNKFDEKGNRIYSKNSEGVEEIWEYDEHNNCIHEKVPSNGWERWYEYDERGNLIHDKISNGWEEWSKYDKNNNLIYRKDTHGYEEWNEYDEHSNRTYNKDVFGIETWWKYDSDGNVVSRKDTRGW